jgi:hypothetical protein
MAAIEGKVKKLDQPVIFMITITLIVLGTTAFLSWGFSSLGWTGPLGLTKGGVM